MRLTGGGGREGRFENRGIVPRGAWKVRGRRCLDDHHVAMCCVLYRMCCVLYRMCSLLDDHHVAMSAHKTIMLQCLLTSPPRGLFLAFPGLLSKASSFGGITTMECLMTMPLSSSPGEREREREKEALLFITAVPNTKLSKLCAWGEEDSRGHVL